MTTTTELHVVARPRPSIDHAAAVAGSVVARPASSWHATGANPMGAAMCATGTSGVAEVAFTAAIGDTTKRPHPGRLETVT